MQNWTDSQKASMWEQVEFYRTHLDVFIMEIFKVKLHPIQQVVARNIGNQSEIAQVKSRGFGKTWQVAICAMALGVLYPQTPIAIISTTAEQATLVLSKIDTDFKKYPDVFREIELTGSSKAVSLTRNKGLCKLKNGSRIESFSMQTIVGTRSKIVIVDEAPLVKKEDIESAASPTKNYRRPVCQIHDMEDFKSKMIYITSACQKSNPFYSTFSNILQGQANGNPEYFACALDYKAAVFSKISEIDFFESERKRMTQSAFAMQYGSIFIGEEEDSVFPFDLTETCRTLTTVEVRQPKHSKSSYVISLDIATSHKKEADNSVQSVLKVVENRDGGFDTDLVFMRSYHGKKLDFQANEIRKLIVRFPNTIKVIFDANGLGDSMPEFLAKPWIDPNTGTEYEPQVDPSAIMYINGAKPLLFGFKANNQLNTAMASGLRQALEHRSLRLPVDSKSIYNNKIVMDGDIDETARQLSLEEQSIFLEADALQVEMGNIVERVSGAGNYTYDTAKSNQRKDRYSSLVMGLWYIGQIEKEHRIQNYRAQSAGFLGAVSYL